MTRQEHLLTCLMEECAEVTKEVSKALRFGLDDRHDEYPPVKDKIRVEFNDLMAVVAMLNDEGIVDLRIDAEMVDKKIKKVEKYIKYAKEKGTLI